MFDKVRTKKPTIDIKLNNFELGMVHAMLTNAAVYDVDVQFLTAPLRSRLEAAMRDSADEC